MLKGFKVGVPVGVAIDGAVEVTMTVTVVVTVEFLPLRLKVWFMFTLEVYLGRG